LEYAATILSEIVFSLYFSRLSFKARRRNGDLFQPNKELLPESSQYRDDIENVKIAQAIA
jgi:hypothetical protein